MWCSGSLCLKALFFTWLPRHHTFLIFLLPARCFLRVSSPCFSFSSPIAGGPQNLLFYFCSLLQSHSMKAHLSCSWLPNIFPSSDFSPEVHATLSSCLPSTTTWASKRHHKINLPVQISVQTWNPGSSPSSLPPLLVTTSFLSGLNPCNHSWPLSFSHTPPRICQTICWLYVHNWTFLIWPYLTLPQPLSPRLLQYPPNSSPCLHPSDILLSTKQPEKFF